ncbi:MAG: transporter substrate-binding domain-containing protein [Legionellaceae bacterium]|nr:transporter substrate-binding domain-containing protein [Legionellaceae bacterium]
MKRILSFCLYVLCQIVYADGPPLTIATDLYSPPFVISGGQKQIFGFDIEMMESICTIMKRTCVYKRMSFEKILPAVESGLVDVGLGSITITLERAQHVHFSLPYLLSYAQFIGTADQQSKDFDIHTLKNKTVAVQEGTVFQKAIQEMDPNTISFESYPTLTTLIGALVNKQVDIGILDAAAAKYWQSQTDEQLVTIGQPFLYGNGFGIAVNNNKVELLNSINNALLQYQANGQFKQNYMTYIE